MLRSYADALHLILDAVEPLGTESTGLANLAGRVIAQPIVAPFDLPRFDNSAVDGYGVVAYSFMQGGAQVTHEVAAGDPGEQGIQPGEAVRIFTGSPIPPGVDAVVMQEDIRREGTFISAEAPVSAGDHIRRRGDELRAGQLAHPAQSLVTPPLLGLIATLGITQVETYKRPTVAILATGNEIVTPGTELRQGQIYESNTFALRAAIQALGLPISSATTTGDNPQETRDALSQALQADVVLTAGGVSVGDHDLVRQALTDNGVEEKLWRIAIKPGKPFYYGIGPNGQKVFGLPGNPVSALVTFFVLVRPALRKMIGLPPEADLAYPLGLGQGFPKTQNRAEFVRATVRDGKAYPHAAQGSHMLSELANADVLLHLPPFSGPYEAGDSVLAIPLRWH